MSIRLLPKEFISDIIAFTFPCPQEVLNYRLVSKLWNTACDSPLIWNSILDREGIKIIEKTDTTVQELLRLSYSQKIRSNDDLIERIQQFFNRCSIGQDCRFQCILKAGSGYEHLTIEIGSANRRDPNRRSMPFLNSREIDIREDYYFVGKLGDCNLIKYLAPNNSCIYSLRRVGDYRAGSFEEPSYGGDKPTVESYFQITHAWNSRAITISIPLKYVKPNGARTPLINQIESMSAIKLGKPEMYTEEEFLNCIMGVIFVAFGYFVANKMIP